MSIAEVEIMATLQLFTLGGCRGMLPQENLKISGVLRRIHCAFWHILRHTEKHTELLEKRLITKMIIAC